VSFALSVSASSTVVTEYREIEEIASNPFWKAIHDDPTKARKGILHHNLAGGPGTEIIPALYSEGDFVVKGKKRYSAFYATDLKFLLQRHKVDHANPCRSQYDNLRSLYRIRGDQPRLSGCHRLGRRGLHGWRGDASLCPTAYGSLYRLATDQPTNSEGFQELTMTYL